MKKEINIIVFSLIVLTNFSKAQFFGPQGSSWYFSKIYVVPNPLVEDYIQVTSLGDSIIHGILCNRLEINNPLFCGDQRSVKYTYYSNDTVFFYEPVYDSFEMLYNMNASPGDTWSIRVPDMNDDDTISIHVNSTDIVTINGIQLKSFDVTYFAHFDNMTDIEYNSTIIERIGDVKYIFNIKPEWSYTCDEAIITGLRCYEDLNTPIYTTGIANSCDFQSYTGIDDVVNEQLKIYPNPSSDKIFLKNDNLDPIDFEIFDLLGNSILKGITNSEIDISKLNPGSYILLSFEKNTKKSTKIEVIK